MNICLLNDSFPPLIDGVANTVVNYAENLKKHGHDPMVVTPKYPDSQDEKYDFPVLRYPGIDVREQIGYIAGYPFSPSIYDELKRRHVDLLHSHCPAASTLLARSMNSQLDVPLVFTYHTKFDIDIANAIHGKLIQESVIKALVNNVNACDEVWVVSEGAGQNLRSLGYEGDYIVMPNGVDVPRRRQEESVYRKNTEGYDLPDDVPIFLFVGRLMWYKGIQIILDAMAALKSQDIDFRMVFIGKGTDAGEIMQYSEKLRLGDKVFFTGPIYDREVLTSWYCRADLFLFPSSFDTNGLVVREAAACSLASVLIKDSCAAEGITNRRNGFFIEENAASLAVLLTQIAGRRDMMRTCGEHASEELYLSWEDSVSHAEERYQIVIDNYKTRGTKRHFDPRDEFFRMQGDLMDFFAEAKKEKSEWEAKVKNLFQ